MKSFYEKALEGFKNGEITQKGKEFLYHFCEFLEDCSHKDRHLHEKFHEMMDEFFVGPHFTEKTLEEALDCLVRPDGIKGRYWSLEQTNDVAMQGRLRFTEGFNQYDFCYAMNYCRAVYSEKIRETLGEESVKLYFALAKAWEPDGVIVPDGAIWNMYKSSKLKKL